MDISSIPDESPQPEAGLDGAAEYADWVDERDMIGGIDGFDSEPWEPDAGELHDSAMVELEGLNVRTRMLVADQYRVFAEILRQAAETPEPWVGPDPTLDPEWRDVRGRGVAVIRRERVDLAVRAAVADMAVRLRLSETTVRMRALHADTLRQRCPDLWAKFLGGQVSEPNAVTAATLAASLPDERECWSDFDEQVVRLAVGLTPAKFRTAARSLRERVHPESIDDRHRRAAEDRDVWLAPELDGMATVTSLQPAADAYAMVARVEAIARHLHRQEGETRTLAQLRADVLSDLVAHGVTDDSGGASSAPAVAITVPVMTVLGEDDTPATLHGYGPIDLDTAKRLAGSAKSWVRVLTHPVTGTVLDLDRKTYRVPEALRRWLGIHHPVCVFPGCNRLARDCDIDHRIEWQYGGATVDSNLAPICKPHHVIKTKTRWVLYRDAMTGVSFWTTPTGFASIGDPAPF